MKKKDTMKKKDKKFLEGIIDNEGFDYAFAHYSSFEEIKDEKFHKLIDSFLAARTELGNYIGLEDFFLKNFSERLFTKA